MESFLVNKLTNKKYQLLTDYNFPDSHVHRYIRSVVKSLAKESQRGPTN